MREHHKANQELQTAFEDYCLLKSRMDDLPDLVLSAVQCVKREPMDNGAALEKVLALEQVDGWVRCQSGSFRCTREQRAIDALTENIGAMIAGEFSAATGNRSISVTPDPARPGNLIWLETIHRAIGTTGEVETHEIAALVQKTCVIASPMPEPLELDEKNEVLNYCVVWGIADSRSSPGLRRLFTRFEGFSIGNTNVQGWSDAASGTHGAGV